MKQTRLILVDAHISPSICVWLTAELGLNASSFRAVGIAGATDEAAFMRARELNAIVLTKDADFPRLLRNWGPPPQIIWITSGNTSNARIRSVLREHLARAMDWLDRGEPLVQIDDSGRD